MRYFLLTLMAFTLLVPSAVLADEITVHKQQRVQKQGGIYWPARSEEKWAPRETAIIVCDM